MKTSAAQTKTNWDGGRKYIFVNLGLDLVSSCMATIFLRRVRLTLWIRASVILRVDTAFEKEIERIV